METENPFRPNATAGYHHHKTVKKPSTGERPDWMTFKLAHDAKENSLGPRPKRREGSVRKRRKMTMKEVEEKLLAAETIMPGRSAETAKRSSEKKLHRGRKRRRSTSSPEIAAEAEAEAWETASAEFGLDDEEAEPESEPEPESELQSPPGLEPEPLGPPPLQNLEDYYDMSVDYRGQFNEPTGPVNSVPFPKLPGPRSDVDKQRDKVAEWEELVEKRKKIVPYNVNLVKHTEDRLLAHKADLERLIAEEPLLCVGFNSLMMLLNSQTHKQFSPPYKDKRIAELQECLQRYENPDEITNVKAAIGAFEQGLLQGTEDQWTVFYNGKIVDKINSYHELLWSVRHPLYQELYGKKGSIWIEPVSYPVLKKP